MQWTECACYRETSPSLKKYVLAGAEGDLLAGLDLHRFPSLRIAAHPRFAPLYLKNAKPDDTDFVAAQFSSSRDELTGSARRGGTGRGCGAGASAVA